ncbi:hypothetical protein BC829DRAFT_395346 [Chytridium lagenaria]|nr:hypothetical protein BC829DRAFT_395346 [Chytridium lagenaria]
MHFSSSSKLYRAFVLSLSAIILVRVSTIKKISKRRRRRRLCSSQLLTYPKSSNQIKRHPPSSNLAHTSSEPLLLQSS